MLRKILVLDDQHDDPIAMFRVWSRTMIVVIAAVGVLYLGMIQLTYQAGDSHGNAWWTNGLSRLEIGPREVTIPGPRVVVHEHIVWKKKSDVKKSHKENPGSTIQTKEHEQGQVVEKATEKDFNGDDADQTFQQNEEIGTDDYEQNQQNEEIGTDGYEQNQQEIDSHQNEEIFTEEEEDSYIDIDVDQVPEEEHIVSLTNSKDMDIAPSLSYKSNDSPGGAAVLFLPCGLDGFWSNMRQTLASVYVAYKFNLTFVEHDLYYDFQDSGHITGYGGPVKVFDILDKEWMGQYLHIESSEEFLSGDASNIKFRSIVDPVRCNAQTSKPSKVNRSFKRFLNLYNLQNHQFTPVGKGQPQVDMLLQMARETRSDRYVFAGSPNLPEVSTDYKLPGMFRTGREMPHFFQDVFQVVKFSKRVEEYRRRALEKLGITERDRVVAIHARRGNTYGYHGVHQITLKEMVNAVGRSHDCVDGEITTIFISTIASYLKGEKRKLQKAFPNLRVVGIGEDVTWNEIDPNLVPVSQSVMRTAVEMSIWFHADAFVGSRSSMSGVVQFMRLAHRPGDACDRFGMRHWEEAYTKHEVP